MAGGTETAVSVGGAALAFRAATGSVVAKTATARLVGGAGPAKAAAGEAEGAGGAGGGGANAAAALSVGGAGGLIR